MPTFDSLEKSQQSSQPIELYEFEYEGITLRYTSSEAPVTISSIVYTPMQLARSEVLESGEIGKNNLTITAPDHFPVSDLFQFGPPDDIVTLTIKRIQFGAQTDIQIIWIGRITSVSWPPLRSEITCESVFTSLRQAGVRRVYTVNCPFALYGVECTVNVLAFQITAIGAVQSGNVVNSSTFATQPNGWWAGGRIWWQYSPGLFQKRGIKNHNAANVEITYAMSNYPSGGTSILVAPGCDHSFTTCNTKFSNQLNYGGFPYMTLKNPWGQSNIF